MPTAAVADARYKRKDKVVAAVNMPGVPEGTRGQVIMVSGFDWIRYWVRFDNGVARGSIDGSKLAPLDQWDEIKRRREAGEDDGPGADGAAASDTDAGDAPAAAGEGYMHNGVLVPQHLLDRSKKRREVLGA